MQHPQCTTYHYNDVIMSAMASQITSLTIVYSTVCSKGRSKKTSKLRVIGLCVGNSPEAGEFPAQRASNAENIFIWWRHHGHLWLGHSISNIWAHMQTRQKQLIASNDLDLRGFLLHWRTLCKTSAPCSNPDVPVFNDAAKELIWHTWAVLELPSPGCTANIHSCQTGYTGNP